MNFYKPVATKHVGIFVRSMSAKAFGESVKMRLEDKERANAIVVADATVDANGNRMFSSPDEATDALPVQTFLEILGQIMVESGFASKDDGEKKD